VILFAVVFNVLLYPLARENAQLNKQIILTRQKLKKYVWLISQKDAIQAKFSAYIFAGKASGEEDPLVVGLAKLESLARGANIRIIDIRPQMNPKAQGPYKESEIELRAEGEEGEFLKFIYDIENSLSLLKIKKFQLSSRPNTRTLEARFSIAQLIVSE